MSRMTDVLGELAKLGAVPPPPKPVEAPVPPPVAPVVEAKPPEPEVVLPPVEQAEAEAAIEALTAGFKDAPAPAKEAKEAKVEPPEEEDSDEEADSEDDEEIDLRAVVRQMRRSLNKMESELDDLKEQLAALEESL